MRAPGADSLRQEYADVNLTGVWATGSVGEPSARRILIRPGCNYTPPLWSLEQRGDTVRLWLFPERRVQGIRRTESVSAAAAAEGMVSGVDLTMGAAGTRYLLRYDSTSGHLRGSKNGAPFWAVREDIVRPEQCLPVP